jgi:hypothetical protein
MRNPVTLAILGSLCAYGQAAGNPPDQPVSVLVYNFAGVPEAILASAEQQAQAIMESAGVKLQWLHCPDALPGISPQLCQQAPGSLTLVLHILSDGANRRNASGDAIGFAVPDDGSGFGYEAVLFYDRVRKLSRAIGIPAALGHGMAHELGHLLLGSGRHSVSGIMKAGWRKPELELAAKRSLRFLPAERNRIRDNLRRRILAATREATSTKMEPPAPLTTGVR